MRHQADPMPFPHLCKFRGLNEHQLGNLPFKLSLILLFSIPSKQLGNECMDKKKGVHRMSSPRLGSSSPRGPS